jgi:hypothetical protein
MKMKKYSPISKIALAEAIESDPKKYQQKIINSSVICSFDADLIEYLSSTRSCKSLQYILQFGRIFSLKLELTDAISADEFEAIIMKSAFV